MTREEAIERLKWVDPHNLEEKDLEAIRITIEALSSYDELYKKAKEVNDMANEILNDFPSYKEALSKPSECESCKWYEPNHLICYPNLLAEPIERISDNTIVVKYADYEDIGRIILTNGDIFCKIFYEDARQNDDSDYDSLVPDEYKTEPSKVDYRTDESANIGTKVNDLISRADAIGIIEDYIGKDYMTPMSRLYSVRSELSALPSADAVTHDLSTETHGRALDGRADTIKELGEWLEQMIQHGAPSHSAKRKALATAIALLSAEAEWIPCSERLPEDSGDYLVCPSDGVIEDYSDCSDVMIMPYDADCEAFGWWTERYDPISLGFVDSDFNEFEVVAWMPLPMPYREDGEV